MDALQGDGEVFQKPGAVHYASQSSTHTGYFSSTWRSFPCSSLSHVSSHLWKSWCFRMAFGVRQEVAVGKSGEECLQLQASFHLHYLDQHRFLYRSFSGSPGYFLLGMRELIVLDTCYRTKMVFFCWFCFHCVLAFVKYGCHNVFTFTQSLFLSRPVQYFFIHFPFSWTHCSGFFQKVHWSAAVVP